MVVQTATESDTVASKTISAPDEIRKYKESLDLGAITQEEYEKKKKQLLDLDN